MTCVANIQEVFSGLGSINVSNNSVPKFDSSSKEKLCLSITRVVIAVLTALVSLAAFLTACVCSSTGGFSAVFCGVVTMGIAVLGLTWASFVLKCLFQTQKN